MEVADKEKIEKLLFERTDISNIDISNLTNIPYPSIAQYRSRIRKYDKVNLETAIKLTSAYDELK